MGQGTEFTRAAAGTMGKGERGEAQGRETAVVRGHQLFYAHCNSCHTPLRATPLGPHLAPDLSTAWKRLGPDAIRRQIREGRPERGMPAVDLAEKEQFDVLAFLEWLNEHYFALKDKVQRKVQQEGEAPSVPWWEFR